MSTNPSHILIARNSRGHNPSASLSSPTETHAAASGIFRSSTSPPWHFEECETDDIVSDLSNEDGENNNEEAIQLDETFTRNSKFPGTVKIIVEATTFWAHKEVLFFASPFFEAALSGNWSETGGRPQSISSVITISQPPSDPANKEQHDIPTEMTFAPMDSEGEEGLDGEGYPDPDDDIEILTDPENLKSDPESSSDTESAKQRARGDSLAKLEASSTAAKSPTPSPSKSTKERDPSATRKKKLSPALATIRRRMKNGPDAVIVLKEEKATTFHDFLKFVYPHLECTITWNNVEGLMNISHKLCVPTLQRECLSFLLTHAAGRPIKAMRIAELFEEEELYREASRFVLDNPGGWSEHELNTLSQETLLKLEKRRNWFLERVLKLGLTMIAKEYQCCPTCPDPATCARLLDEKWRQAYHAVFRFGPPQPSMVFRYLRMLEGVSPPLSLTQTACQASAKAFTATLFDRMFSLGLRGSGTETTPIGARVAVAAVAGAASGPRRHFLYCALKNESPQKNKRTRSDQT
ncbi:hypothetical protein CC1G_11551 [Coprinopsis cinerea okayama7|uniref:BTB domain-containing protein n=1 Tax=Coprinopsis cinerea (strain Okayama-7 / 130 / ATCC MYA-4618 / FGSC 9003) TaxID=240176 RepID=A8N6T7_COPC7|nr:hypothetical protein CC1G_11551 [Coprinopsis cinerea okayama7\|eukprot:XP_001830543.2 hypothetical protein CC1G_11551 [Coprinopsis cinerea okayama7\